MPNFLKNLAHRFSPTVTLLLLIAAITSLSSPSALASITGGEGNKRLADPGWPKGAAAIFNTESRIAWWEGPPYGGGQWHSECRGDARALSEILAGFATLEVKNKRVILHDGVGASFWLNMNREPAKRQVQEWTGSSWFGNRRTGSTCTNIVEMLPEGGSVVGSWGGSSNIDAANQVMFRDVPAGRYVIRGRPNPSSANQGSKPLAIELKSGQATRLTLPAS